MKIKNIFNQMGFAGRYGKLGTVIDGMISDISGLGTEQTSIKKDIKDIGDDVKGLDTDLGNLETLVNKIKAATKVTITFDSDGGTSVASQTIAFGGKATQPTDPTKSGYIFSCWIDTTTDTAVNFAVDTFEADAMLRAYWTELTEVGSEDEDDEGSGGEE